MKTLLLLRHAKSDWSDPWLDDVDRPLAPRGRGAAPRLGRYMAEKGLVPDLVLCSAARRARETWELLALELLAPEPTVSGRSAGPEVRIRMGLYAASSAALIRAIRRAPTGCNRLLVIGHNPEIEDAVHRLAARGKKKALARLAEKYPTGALAEIRFDTDDWTAVGHDGGGRDGQGELRRFVRPRDLR